MIKVSIVLLAGVLGSTVLRRRSAALRHWVLAWAVVCAAAMPVAEMLAPAWRVPLPLWMAARQVGGSESAPASATEWRADDAAAATRLSGATRSSLTNRLSVGGIWIGGVAVSALLLLVGFVRLAWMTARARRVVDGPWAAMAETLEVNRSSRTRVRLLQSEHPALLVTWGLVRPAVIVPIAARDWPADQVRAVLSHELAHVDRRDWALQMVAEVLRCVYWFNPLSWLVCRLLRKESEQACDDLVVNAGIDAPEYATHLLAVARAFTHVSSRRSLFPAPAMARPSDLERRVRVMLNTRLNRAPLSRLAAVGIAVGLLAVTIPVAGVVAAPQVPQHGAPQAIAVAATRTASGDLVLRVSPAEPQTAATRDVASTAPERPAVVRAESQAAPVTDSTTVLEQGTTGECVGTFKDATGRTVPNVSITLAHVETSLKFETKTDENGRFAVGGLANGRYLVEARKPGFRTVKMELVLAGGKQMTVDGALQIGSLAEMVVVSSGGRAAAAGAPQAKTVAVVQLRRPGAPAPDPCSESTVGGCITPPAKLKDMKPAYPAVHAAADVSGEVVVEARIGIDGLVIDPRANDGADPAFAAAAIEAVSHWEFSPVKLNGIPQECRVTVTVRFQAADK